jgi:hypothetical protein
MRLTRTLVCSMVAAGCLSVPALAALGGGAASVEADRASLSGTLRVSSAAGYAVHEIKAASGLTVHEYVSAEGKVFAVSWRGPRIPDLRQMLGSSYEAFEQARAATPTHYDHRHLSIETPQLVVQSSGYLRSFVGRAWVPALLPQNFSVTSID